MMTGSFLILCALVIAGRACTDADIFGFIDESDSFRLSDCINALGENFWQIQENNVIKRTPLIYACSEGKLQVAEQILDIHPASFTDRDAEGRTSLMWASWNGHLELVKLLFRKGSRFEDTDLQGRNSLMFAVMGKHMQVISFATTSLEQYPQVLESVISEKDSNGKNSLEYALERGATQIYNHLNKFVLHHQAQDSMEVADMVGLRSSSQVHHVGEQSEVKEPQPFLQNEGKPSTCSGNVLSWIRVCDRNGICVPEGSKNCCPYLCDTSTNQCKRTCEEDSDCCEQYTCSSTRKCVLKRNPFDWRAVVGFVAFLGLLVYVFS